MPRVSFPVRLAVLLTVGLGFAGTGLDGPPGVSTPGPTLAETPASPPFDP